MPAAKAQRQRYKQARHKSTQAYDRRSNGNMKITQAHSALQDRRPKRLRARKSRLRQVKATPVKTEGSAPPPSRPVTSCITFTCICGRATRVHRQAKVRKLRVCGLHPLSLESQKVGGALGAQQAKNFVRFYDIRVDGRTSAGTSN